MANVNGTPKAYRLDDLPNDIEWATTAAKRSVWEYPDLFANDDLFAYSSGVYILVAHRPPSRPGHPFAYPLGRSSVYYIGMTKKGQPRLFEHQYQANLSRVEYRRTGRVLDTHPRYNYAARFGADVYWVSVQGRETPRNLEARLMGDFYKRFGALPVANGQWSSVKRAVPRARLPEELER